MLNSLMLQLILWQLCEVGGFSNVDAMLREIKIILVGDEMQVRALPACRMRLPSISPYTR